MNFDVADGGAPFGAARVRATEPLHTPWCRDQRYARNDPNPRLGSDDADIAWTSQLQHAIEDMDRHADFSHPTFVYT
jgi:hypothetical protein